MVAKRMLRNLLAWALMVLCANTAGDPVWVVDPGNPGPDAPEQGRSLFDFLTIRNGQQEIPYPFEKLLAHLNDRLDTSNAYLGQSIKQVLIPLGRSLQREAAAPNYFHSPRIVVAVDSEPVATSQDAGILLRDRLYIGYLEAADVLEIISYNEAAARFEFQVVHDYRGDAKPQVTYARRVVCMACHQNAAPIFARPLWDETNANQGITSELDKVASAFHGVPSRTGVDVAYAIDNATDRANEFSLTQKLWHEGCGAGDAGRRCRQALLIRTFQFALSAGRGFDQESEDYKAGLRQPMLDQRQRLWPDGLLIPDANIANRNPLAGPLAEKLTSDRVDLRRRANITAQFEPLSARPAASTWLPDPDAWVAQAIHGLSQFIARPDVLAIDRSLAQGQAKETRIELGCTTAFEQQATQDRIKLTCESAEISLRGLIYRSAEDRQLSGRLRSVQVLGDDLGALNVNGYEAADGTLEITLQRFDMPGRVRLSSGDAVAGLRLRRPEYGADSARLELHIVHDFERLEEAIVQAAEQHPALFANGPFRRAEVLPVLFRALGAAPREWCCATGLDEPATQTTASEPPPDDPLLRPFFQVCGACHRSDEPFPPNFLAGSAEQARRTLAHCAERIQYRLGMWDLPPQERPKSPMPPQHAGGLEGTRLLQWTNGLLPQLRASLLAISESLSTAPANRQLPTTPYYELRRCLPAD